MAKGKVKKIVSIIGILLLVLIVVGILAFNLYGDSMIKAGIETGAQKALQVDVRLENISTALFRGKVELTNLEIDNPEGYQHESFMQLGHAYVNLDMGSLLSDTVVIDKIQLDNISVTIEQKGTTSNLNQILGNLPKTEEEEPAAKDEEQKAGKDLQITSLEINGVTVKAKLLPIPGRADTVTLKLNPIHLENIGSKEKVDAADLTAKILKAIAGGIAEQGKDLLPTEMIGDIAGELAKQGEELIKAGGELGKGVIDAGADIGKTATDTLNNLNPFKQKEETPEEEK